MLQNVQSGHHSEREFRKGPLFCMTEFLMFSGNKFLILFSSVMLELEIES